MVLRREAIEQRLKELDEVLQELDKYREADRETLPRNLSQRWIVERGLIAAALIINNQAAQQTATGNWWGAATGPNTPGADTTGGNIDTSGFLAAPPIPGCSRPIYLPIIWATFHETSQSWTRWAATLPIP